MRHELSIDEVLRKGERDAPTEQHHRAPNAIADVLPSPRHRQLLSLQLIANLAEPEPFPGHYAMATLTTISVVVGVPAVEPETEATEQPERLESGERAGVCADASAANGSDRAAGARGHLLKDAVGSQPF